LRGWATNDLDKIAGTQLPGKRGFHVASIQFKIPLRCAYWFIERKANLSAPE
jgi:hypothetical protein